MLPTEPLSLQTCSLCVSLIGSTERDVSQQIKQAIQQGADLVELRLDKWEKLHGEVIEQLKREFSIPMMLTLRKASQGGDFKGSEREQLAILHSLVQVKPDYMDLEADLPLAEIQLLQQASPQTKWIISWHDFLSTPSHLEALFQTISLIPAHFYKIATKTHSICDALRLLRLAMQVNSQKSVLCALGMGEVGECTRILSPLVGNPFTFASLEEGQESAPGQLSMCRLLDTYHFRRLNRKTFILGLIGDPVGGSLSHFSHNAVLRQLQLNGVYVKFRVASDELTAFLSHIRHFNIKGLSVTMPHKEGVWKGHLTTSSHSSLQEIQACNTLLFSEDGVKGCNTDGKGALKAMGLSTVARKKMIILGAGGTAKAIAYEAIKQGIEVIILNRTEKRAKEIAERLGCQWGSLSDFSSFAKQGYEILVQTTSVGMAPESHIMPILAEDLLPCTLVLDTIWNPIETTLLRTAHLKKCQIVNGLDMFIHQAVAQFIYWFGDEMNQELIEETIRTHLPFSRKRGVSIYKSQLEGTICLPPSKSHSIRAILLGALACGTSYVYQPLRSPDIMQAIQAARQLGAVILDHLDYLEIQGLKGNPHTPDNVIDAGNSGQVLRFVSALAALGEHYTVVTGDQSVRSNRPIQPLLEGLRHLGVFAESTRQNGYAPVMIKGPLQPGRTCLSGEDSQPVSALLMAAAFVEGETEIQVQYPGEKPWIDLTLAWLKRLGVPYQNENFEYFKVKGSKYHPAFSVRIPGDFSSAAFPLVAALLTHSEIQIDNVEMEDVQGDKAIISLLQQMGALIEIDSKHQCIKVLKGPRLKGGLIDVNPIIDAIPILAVVGCYAEDETRLINGAIGRHKECDRIACIASELKKMGAKIDIIGDELRIHPAPLHGATVQSHHDHRIALALIVAGLVAEGETYLEGVECIQKSYPSFIKDMQCLGAILNDDKS